MTALAGPVDYWGKKECASVRGQALSARDWPDGGPQMPPIKVSMDVEKALYKDVGYTFSGGVTFGA